MLWTALNESRAPYAKISFTTMPEIFTFFSYKCKAILSVEFDTINSSADPRTLEIANQTLDIAFHLHEQIVHQTYFPISLVEAKTK